ncbi:MAG: methyltransferase domain-containing protein [Sulfurimonas sp.]|jgi:SAM-dependent methyltransferase|nr:methyltransferase domain-containing protein [Sulfurimonadaceae bacterium]
MLEDKNRWNEKHKELGVDVEPSKIIKDFLDVAKIGTALDIACGSGRNTHFLADAGFSVDAIDISDYALAKIKNSAMIGKVEADLDKYNLTPNKYDLVININYLNRRLMPQIKESLKSGGVLVFESFMVAYGDFNLPTANVEHLLRKNELLHTFIGLDIIYYEERVITTPKGEKIKVASLVAKKA